MFLYHWVERVGRVVAPDARYEAQPRPEPHPLLAVVAPYPSAGGGGGGGDDDGGTGGAGATGTPLHTPRAGAAGAEVGDVRRIQCVHCGGMVPLPRAGAAAAVAAAPVAPAATPSSAGRRVTRSGLSDGAANDNDDAAPLDPIRRAAMQTERLKSPQFKDRDPQKKFFSILVYGDGFKADKDGPRLRQAMERHPDWLTGAARTLGFGTAVPDGYTPLMAASHLGNATACRILLEVAPAAQLRQHCAAGKTALHLAAERGHGEVLAVLLAQARELGLPVDGRDVLGRTPLGLGLASPEAKARRNRGELLRHLYSADDPAIVGDPPPYDERTIGSDALRLAMACADMPGKRGTMEDATIMELQSAKAIVGVFDGHADGGECSSFVSQSILRELEDRTGNWTDILKETFHTVDTKLGETKIEGGSTGVVAVLTRDQIAVANAGDCRCFLIQTAELGDLVEQLASLSIADSKECQNTFVVKPLSEDHKPDRETEKARIEKAGLSVKDDGGIPKVALVDKYGDFSLLGPSRGFGDFEFKANESLSDGEQAVVCTPDVVIHSRTPQDAFLILACDGIFDVMSNEEVAEAVMTKASRSITSGEDFGLARTADHLLQECLHRPLADDNMSVVIVAMNEMALKLQNDLPKTRLDFSGASATS